MENCLENMKKDYEALRQKYNIPEFKLLNEEFSIEEISEKQTDYLLREIRRQIIEKILAYLRFIETIMNPSNAPLFIFSLIKGLSESDKKMMEEAYFRLVEYEVGSIELDNDYSEEKEAEFINNLFSGWKLVKDDVREMIEGLKRGLKLSKNKKERGYLG